MESTKDDTVTIKKKKAVKSTDFDTARRQLWYGASGMGKSWQVNKQLLNWLETSQLKAKYVVIFSPTASVDPSFKPSIDFMKK
jgi:hypothetical protein